MDQKVEVTSDNVVFYENCNDVKCPTRGTQYSACWDVFANKYTDIEPKKTVAVSTGLKISLPPKTMAQLHTRSSMAIKGITVEGGIIDSDYRGEIKVVLCNRSDENFIIHAGDRIAQMDIRQLCDIRFIPVMRLTDTDRGDGGFGSTGR